MTQPTAKHREEARELALVLLPFARAANDYEPPKSSRPWRDEEHIALSLTVGDVRRARRACLAARALWERVRE